MSKNEMRPEAGPATRAIHLGYDPAEFRGALTPPMFLTSTYAFETAEEGAAIFAGEAPGLVYGRTKNPTQQLLEERMASLENTEAGLAVASGMAAITTTIFSLAKAGDTILVDQVIYGCSFAFFARGVTEFGVETKIIDMTDLGVVEEAMKTKPKLVFFETPSNPNVRMIDIEQVTRLAHDAGAMVVVDNTFATPIIQRPCELGADLVVHSATKFLGGHGDLLGGIVCGSQEHINKIRGLGIRVMTGATISPFNAFQILRGLKTLKLRVDAHSVSAQIVAEHLAGSDKIKSVFYPTLPDYPQRDLAKKQMGQRGGAIVAVRFKGGVNAGHRFINALELIKCAVSLGDAETLVQHPATMTHSIYSAAERADFGIDDDLLRIAVGLEEVEDLIWDIDNALVRV
ncbi:MAG: aminotransferase class I/II-fold pyridoxal phosphate-dependent enzyme [Stappiaceae bacterium]